MTAELIKTLGVVLAAVVAAVGGWLANRVAARSANESAEVSWVQELRAEIRELRTRVETLEAQGRDKDLLLGGLGDFLDALSVYVLYGRQGPYPDPPADAASYYNRQRWLMIKAANDKEQS